MSRYGRPKQFNKKRETIEDIIYEGAGTGFKGRLGLDYITAFSDASWKDGLAGWGGRIIHGEGPVRDSYSGNMVTNNSTDAEYYAAQTMLDKVWETTDFVGKRVMIQTDCASILRSLTVPDQVLDLVNRVTIRHVKGHINSATGARFAINNWCDRRATEMRLALEDGTIYDLLHSSTAGNEHIPVEHRKDQIIDKIAKAINEHR